MKPIKFPEANVMFAVNQSEYAPLPAFKRKEPHGGVVSCWQLTLIERLRLLFTGKIWLCMLTFQKPLQPVQLTTEKHEVLMTENVS